MGLQSALTTSLTGLQAAETTIDVVGNNVANSNTVGFKESSTIFATQFLQTISIGSAPNTNSGGTNPRQIGLGVKVSQISPDFSQGTIEISSNPLDVAIQGDGFLVVQGLQGEQLFTRNGQLNLNSINELTTTTGQRILGYTVNDNYEIITDSVVPLSIPVGEERVAQATTEARFNGVLNPAVDLGSPPSISESIVLGDGLVEQPLGVPASFGQATQPSISSVNASSAGAGTGPSSVTDYTYRFAFRDTATGAIGEYSSAYTYTQATGGHDVDLTSVPLPSLLSAYDETVIFRNDGSSTDFREIGTTTTGSYTDTWATNDLPGNLPVDLTDNVDAGSYDYYITFSSSSSPAPETRPSEIVPGPSITSSTGGRVEIDLSGITLPTDYDEINIYRNLSSDITDFRLVETIPTTQSFYIDTADSADIAGNAALNFDGPDVQFNTPLINVLVRTGSTYDTPFEEGILTFSAEKDGVGLTPKEFMITDTTTVAELLDFMEDALGIDEQLNDRNPDLPSGAGSVTLQDGRFVITSNLGEENAIEVPPTAFRMQPTGSAVSSNINLSFTETQAAEGPGTSTEMIVYDSLGLPLKVRITTALEEFSSDSTTYRWYATSAENQPTIGESTVVGNGIITFDSNGDLVSAPNATITVLRNATASESPLAVDLNFSQVKALGQTDAQGNLVSTLNFASQDGFPPGVLTDFIITEDGLIQGQFNNGVQRTLGQLVMARFANNQGLQQVGDSLFARSVNSGEPIYATAGAEGIGTLTAGAVELSNTDIGSNLIELILASTQYRGGARVITTSQELLDELLALRR